METARGIQTVLPDAELPRAVEHHVKLQQCEGDNVVECMVDAARDRVQPKGWRGPGVHAGSTVYIRQRFEQNKSSCASSYGAVESY